MTCARLVVPEKIEHGDDSIATRRAGCLGRRQRSSEGIGGDPSVAEIVPNRRLGAAAACDSCRNPKGKH